MQVSGRCYVLFALDAGFHIDLAEAERRLSARHPRAFEHKRRASTGEGTGSPPLRLTRSSPALAIGPHRTAEQVDVAVYDFGGVCVTYSLGLQDLELEELVTLSSLLYDNVTLLQDSQLCAREILATLGSAIREPRLSEVVEDYVVYDLTPRPGLAELWTTHGNLVARVLRAERRELSQEEQEQAFAGRISYAPSEVAFIDWFAALLVGEQMDDERRVLELVTLELVELRHLDWILESRIDGAYDLLARSRKPRMFLAPFSRELARIARIQADSAVLHEGIDNALKLLGDDYLARFYRLASSRFYFADWDASIERKLATLESIYSKLADLAARRRAEFLEWIIIVLIAVDIVLYLLPRA
jgi:hypothetical protein